MKVDFGRSAENGRAPELDTFRGCFVFAMFAAHLARFTEGGPLTLSGRFWSAVSYFEPAISAGFLFVVGVSLEVSASRARSLRGIEWRGWYPRLLLRALTLYLVAIALFISQYGFQLPDALLSPDILSAIAFALVSAGLAMAAGGLGQVALATLVLVVVALLETAGVSYSGLNAGPGGALPLVSFTALGVLFARSSKRFITLLLVTSGLALAALALPGEWVANVESTYDGGTVTFWNHTVKGALLIGAPLLFIAGFVLRLGAFCRASSLAWLRLLGRHALLAYLMHLVILEASRRVDLFPLSGVVAAGYLGSLVLVVCVLLSWTRRRGLSAWLNRTGERLGVRF